MTYRGLLKLGGVEIANSARAVAYFDKLAAPGLSVTFDDSWTHTARFLGQQDYRLPTLDQAPWYDPLDPDSADFGGIWPMQVEGLDSAKYSREIVQGNGDGGTFGKGRYDTRTINVTALLYATTSAGVDYGVRWLSSILRGDRCKGDFAGQILEYLTSAPDVDPSFDNAAFAACVAPYQRVLHEVVMTAGPTITERFAVVETADGPHATAYRVEFELTAGIPWAYRPAVPLVTNLKFNTVPAATPIYFVIATGGVCPEAQCTKKSGALVDPSAPLPSSVIRPVPPRTITICEPLDSRTASAVIPASAIPKFHDLVGSMTVQAGSTDTRQLRIRWARQPAGTTLANALLCNTISDAGITYIPANGTLTLDGVTNRIWVTLADGTMLDGSSVVTGANGGPWRPPVLSCGDPYVVVIDGPGNVSSGLTVNATGAVRES